MFTLIHCLRRRMVMMMMVSVCLASVLLESVKQTHPLRSSLLLQIENTFVLCFHRETSESRARDSVTEAGETLKREILLFIPLVPRVYDSRHVSLLQVRHALVNTCRSSDAPHWSDFRRTRDEQQLKRLSGSQSSS